MSYGITKMSQFKSLGFFSNYEYLNNNTKFNFGIHGNTYKNNFIELDAIQTQDLMMLRFKKKLASLVKLN